MSSVFRIPQPYEEAFQDFFNLENETRKKLISLLGESSLEISNRNNLKRIASKLDLPLSMLFSFDRMIFSLFSLIDDKQLPVLEIVDGLFDAIKENDNIEVDNEILPELKDQFIKILSLQNESYGLSAKAVELSNEYKNIFVDSKILTDIRPIFKKEIDAPISVIILHNLKIVYHNDKKIENIFLTIDSEDIDNLIQALERARQKEISLKKYLNEKEMNILKFDEER